MKAVCRFFGKTDRFGETRGSYMGDHNCWTGWDVTTLDEGHLLLRAEWFDS